MVASQLLRTLSDPSIRSHTQQYRLNTEHPTDRLYPTRSHFSSLQPSSEPSLSPSPASSTISLTGLHPDHSTAPPLPTPAPQSVASEPPHFLLDMSESDATLFHGDGREGENPQDFLNKVERGFDGRVLSERDKVNRCKLWLKSGSEAKEWFMSLGNDDWSSWSQFVLAFELRWPEEVITRKTMAERQGLLMAELLQESDVGVRTKIDGTEELRHVRWAQWVRTLALAVPDKSGLLISAVRAQMPTVLKDKVNNTYTTWEAFTSAVCDISLLDIEEAKRKESRLRTIELTLQNSTSSLLSSFGRLNLSPPASNSAPVVPPPTPKSFAHHFPPAPGPPSPNLFLPPAAKTPRAVFRSDAERLVDAHRNRLPHHPATADGLLKYKAQVITWTTGNPSGKPNEYHPYPLTPGTAPVGSGECRKCGMLGHRGDSDPSTNLVPELEMIWRRIAGGIHSRANTAGTAAPVQMVGMADAQVLSWLMSDAYKEAIIAHYLEQQENDQGSSA